MKSLIKKYEILLHLKVKTQQLGRPFLTRYEIESAIKEYKLYTSNLSATLDAYIKEGRIKLKREDITINYRLDCYYIV